MILLNFLLCTDQTGPLKTIQNEVSVVPLLSYYALQGACNAYKSKEMVLKEAMACSGFNSHQVMDPKFLPHLKIHNLTSLCHWDIVASLPSYP